MSLSGLKCRFLPAILLSLLVISVPVNAQPPTQASDPNLRTIRAILELPDQRIDLARTKLTIDHMIDPGIDIANGLKQLDGMERTVQLQLPAMATSRDKLDALRAYLYRAGPWNANRPFSYDLDDPLGHNIRHKLLPTYLATRKGNCVSMPVLFIILGQKLGLDLAAATAPQHIFVKYRDDLGNYYNIEATSGGGFARDAWMQQKMPMSKEALANGIYMQPLSNKETVSIMAGTLLEYYGQQGWEKRRIALAELILKHYPKDVSAMLHISSAYYRLRQQHFVNKYPTPADIPLQERARLVELEKNIGMWRDKAMALGWRDDN